LVDFNSIYSRFRPPRYITARNVVNDYNLDLALVNQILSQSYNGKYATGQTIKFYTRLNQTDSKGTIINRDPNSSILIITDKMLLYLQIEIDGPKRGKPHSIFKTKLRKIKSCEVVKFGDPKMKQFGNLYYLTISTYSQRAGNQNFRFQTTDYHKFEKVYNLL